MLTELLNEVQELEWSSMLPPIKSIQFLAGNQYQTGFDYPHDILEMPVQDSCSLCDNTGISYIPNGEDDVDAMPCDCIAGEINLFNQGLVDNWKEAGI